MVANRARIILALGKLSKYEHRFYVRLNEEVKEVIGLQELARDALELIKERDASVPFQKGRRIFRCGACQMQIEEGFQFCPRCGRMIAWERFVDE